MVEVRVTNVQPNTRCRGFLWRSGLNPRPARAYSVFRKSFTWGKSPTVHPPLARTVFPAYDCGRLRDHRTSRTGEPAGIETRCENNRLRRFPVVYDELIPKLEASVKVLISFRAFMIDA
jgi:hypothetical protein